MVGLVPATFDSGDVAWLESRVLVLVAGSANEIPHFFARLETTDAT